MVCRPIEQSLCRTHRHSSGPFVQQVDGEELACRGVLAQGNLAGKILPLVHPGWRGRSGELQSRRVECEDQQVEVTQGPYPATSMQGQT